MVNSPKTSDYVFDLPQSVADQIYKLLRQKIMDQEIRGGDRLIETALAETYAISRTPIREALRRLEQDGLVERMPQGGLRVTSISAEEVKDVYGIRAVLSSYAAELACDLMDRETLAELRDIIGRSRTVLEDSSMSGREQAKRLFELNTVFHETLNEAAGSPRLSTMLNNLRDMVLRFRVLCLQDERIRMEACTEHERIVALLEAGDKATLSALMRDHVLAGGEAALRALGASGESAEVEA